MIMIINKTDAQITGADDMGRIKDVYESIKAISDNVLNIITRVGPPGITAREIGRVNRQFAALTNTKRMRILNELMKDKRIIRVATATKRSEKYVSTIFT